MVNKIFKHHFRRNVEVYIDDMIIKSKMVDTHLEDLTETFQILKRYNMHLNMTKCAFGAS